MSTRHNPEFTMLEYYEAFTSLEKTIEFTENMIKSASEEVNNSLKIMWGDDEIDLSNFRKSNLSDLVLEENNNLTQGDIDKLINITLGKIIIFFQDKIRKVRFPEI